MGVGTAFRAPDSGTKHHPANVLLSIDRRSFMDESLWLYARGDARLDALLDLSAGPTPSGLRVLCERLATAAKADVTSIYVRERDPFLGDAELVLRGNVGFPPEAVGKVRLSMGEGLVGHVADSARIVKSSRAAEDPRFARVAGLSEERFPAFLAVPLCSNGSVLGVLALQRREGEFHHEDVCLAIALSATAARALETPRDRTFAAGGRMLRGRRMVAGKARGLVQAAPPHDVAHGLREPARVLASAFASITSELDDARRAVRENVCLSMLPALVGITPLLHDPRLRALARGHAGAGVAQALRRAVRERCCELAGETGSDGPWLLDRAGELRDLTLLVAARAAGMVFPARGRVLATERLSVVMTLAAIARGVAGVVVSDCVDEIGLATTLLHAAHVPTIAEVDGLLGLAAGTMVALEEDGRIRIAGD